MRREAFMRLQFSTLRDEIRDTKARIYKTVAFGIGVVPAANYVARTYEIPMLVLAMPLLVMVVGFLYLAENHALMRCGRYIRFCIEPSVPDTTGWETWLSEDERATRSVDRYMAYSFYLVFALYFVGSVVLAVRYVLQQHGVASATAVTVAYGALGVAFGSALARNIRVSTGVSREPMRVTERSCAAAQQPDAADGRPAALPRDGTDAARS